MNTFKKFISYSLIILAIVIISSFQLMPDSDKYNEQWQKVENFVKKGQPKSAIKIVDEIYKTAKGENDKPQIIKSLIYRVSLQSQFEEEHIIKSIDIFKREIETASTPEKQILQSLVAELFQTYYNSNRWVINSREIVSENDSEDINTWDALTLNKEIEKYYSASLQNEKELSKIPLKNYNAVLLQGDSANTTLFPYLFDLLANRALNYFTSSDYEFTQMSTPVQTNSANYLIPTPEFANLKINPLNNKESFILSIFQKLISLHIKNNNTEALVDLDLRRLKYVENNSNHSSDIGSKYISSLTYLAKKYNNHPVFVSIAFELANQYFIDGKNYSPKYNEDNKFNFVKADSICKLALKQFPDVIGSNKCRNLSEQINQVDFKFDIQVAQSPDSPTLSLIEFKNIDRLYFKVVVGNPKANADRHNKKENIQNQLREKEVISWEQELPATTDHRSHSVEIKIPELPLGYYIIFASNDSLFSTTQTIKFKPIWITNLSYITSANPSSEHTDMYIVNRETGKSIGDVSITIYKQSYDNRSRNYTIKEIGKVISDNVGYAKIESISDNNYGTYLFEFEKDGDKLFSENYLNFFRATENNKPKIKTFLFTDRAVYRPGQTVYFKGIVTEEIAQDIKLLKDYTTDIEFTNSSRKIIASTKFTTTEDGSFNGFFTIPIGGLNGQMTIKSKTGSIQILVENYKLPTFEVVFDSLTGQPKLGDNISITGSAMGYAGNAVDGAEVKYRVIRKVNFPWPYYRVFSWFPPNIKNDLEITNGVVTTSSLGKFSVQFDAIADNNISLKTDPVFTYEIITEVTDITGEVQTGQTSVKIGTKSVILDIEIPEVVELGNIGTPKINAKNLNGSGIKFEATITVYKLTPPTRLLSNRPWPQPEFSVIPEKEFIVDFPHLPYKNEIDPLTWDKTKVAEGQLTILGSGTIPANLFSELEQGEYLIIAEGKDNQGNTIETKQVFTLYSSSGKKMPGNMIEWVAVTSNKAEPGETIKLVVGSATRKTPLMYEIVNGKNIIERNWITLNKGQKIIEIPVVEAYRGNFSINVTMVKFNEFYSKNINIVVPFTNKELYIYLETFRSHLTPGQKEEWKVTISGKDGQKLSAELLAGMYDASLNIFRTNQWQMNLYHNKSRSSGWESNQFNTSLSATLFMPELKYYRAASINYPTVNWFGYQNMGYNSNNYGGMDYNYRKSVIAQESMGLEEEELTDNVLFMVENDENISGDIDTPEINQQKETIPLRSNFNETAFFFPNLKTDELGNVSFSFNTPDALTEWKILMLAYTNDLKVGTLERKIKSQKELMIIPNVPRFVRQGDTLLFTAKVINFTDNSIDALSKIEFFDAITMKSVSLFIDDNDHTISQKIKPKQSGAVSWRISIPDDISMLSYKITSSTGTFTDGEERMFPVLTNRMLVTSSLPMNVSGLSTTDFKFDALEISNNSSSTNNYKYTIEFTSNPAWYAVQALPYLSAPENSNYMSLFNSYFANSLSSFIVNSNPNIKAVFESWKNITPEALLSNLEKNQELKNTILEATPWVLEADDESEQKRRIAILFDVNIMSDSKEEVLNKLYEGQLPSGAWPWFNGMKEDRHTTQSITLGMAKLHHKGVLDLKSGNKRFQMVRKAITWLDAEIASDYVKLKKTSPKLLNNYNLRSSQTQYLYLRSLLVDIIPIPDKSNEAIEYYINQASKYWLKQSNYLQGMTAIMLHSFGHRNESEAIIRSLKERSLYSKDLGMYWRQETGWNWYQAPVETQAMMIETMAQLDNNPTVIEQLKIWLIKQKQTQHWKTSTATAEAVYALLMYGNNSLENNELVEIKVGEKMVDVSTNSDITAEAGTGYFSTSWAGKEITAELSNITVKNPNNNIAWGAAYWQYFEDMDKIESHNSPLSISKNLFVEKLTNEGPVLVAFDMDQELKTGDKVVVRLIISTDRAMEYVHLKDMRATAFEPVSPLSGYSYSGGLWYYKNITDVSTEFFMRYLNKGTYVLEYPLFVTQKGDFTNGIATIQSMYAPEFGAHSSGLRIKVGE